MPWTSFYFSLDLVPYAFGALASRNNFRCPLSVCVGGGLEYYFGIADLTRDGNKPEDVAFDDDVP